MKDPEDRSSSETAAARELARALQNAFEELKNSRPAWTDPDIVKKALKIFRREIAGRRPRKLGRPRNEHVTLAVELHKQHTPWSVIFAHLGFNELDKYARIIEESKLRHAVAARISAENKEKKTA